MTTVATLTGLALGLMAFAKEHPEVLKALEDLVLGGHITVEQSNAMIRALMVEASDVEMKRELGV